MIYRGYKKIDNVYRGKKAITMVYRGYRLVWEAIKSCFGKGYWQNEVVYSNTDMWRNNK